MLGVIADVVWFFGVLTCGCLAVICFINLLVFCLGTTTGKCEASGSTFYSHILFLTLKS